MSRPIKRRNVKSYTRDIESLGRLRIAILMDNTLDASRVTDAIQHIDRLTKRLIELTTDLVKQSA